MYANDELDVIAIGGDRQVQILAAVALMRRKSSVYIYTYPHTHYLSLSPMSSAGWFAFCVVLLHGTRQYCRCKPDSLKFAGLVL